MPRGPETQIYSIAGTDLSLVATAEITLGGAFHERIFEADELPLKLCGISHCFRTEAGAHGKATRGPGLRRPDRPGATSSGRRHRPGPTGADRIAPGAEVTRFGASDNNPHSEPAARCSIAEGDR